jgi:hypothetical protein
MTRTVVVALLACAPAGAFAQSPLMVTPVVRANRAIDACGAPELRGRLLDTPIGVQADGSAIFLAVAVNEAGQLVQPAPYVFRDGCWEPAAGIAAADGVLLPAPGGGSLPQVWAPPRVNQTPTVAAPHPWSSTVRLPLSPAGSSGGSVPPDAILAAGLPVHDAVSVRIRLHGATGITTVTVPRTPLRRGARESSPHVAFASGRAFLTELLGSRQSFHVWDLRQTPPVPVPTRLPRGSRPSIPICSDGRGAIYLRVTEGLRPAVYRMEDSGALSRAARLGARASGHACLRSGGFVWIDPATSRLGYHDGRSTAFFAVDRAATRRPLLPDQVDRTLWVSASEGAPPRRLDLRGTNRLAASPRSVWAIDLAPILPTGLPTPGSASQPSPGRPTTPTGAMGPAVMVPCPS